ncbi:MAG: DUF1269 domain-containing protein [Prochloraceae cyanobacterium]
MSKLVVIGFDDEFRAAEVRLALMKMQDQNLIELQDAAVVVRNSQGQLKITQDFNVEGQGILSLVGGFWGLFLGTLLAVPLLGVAAGMATGSLIGSKPKINLDKDFIAQLTETLTPGSSALLMLVRRAEPEPVLQQLREFDGKILQTSLSPEDEQKLLEAMSSK